MLRNLSLLCAALLPWRIAYRLIQALALRDADEPEAVAAYAEAAAWGLAPPDSAAFCRRFATYRLVDYADLGLALTRGRGWVRRWTRHIGPDFPKRGAYLALTFHYGAGLMAMHALSGHERGVAWIYAAPVQSTSLRWRLSDIMTRLRIGVVAKLGGVSPIPTGGAVDAAQEWLAQGGAIVALLDAPPDGRRDVVSVPFCGRKIGLPSGLVRLAARAGVPIYLYTAALAHDGGMRLLRVEGPLRATDTAAAMARVGAALDQAVRDDPAAWHYWGAAAAAFPPPVVDLDRGAPGR